MNSPRRMRKRNYTKISPPCASRATLNFHRRPDQGNYDHQSVQTDTAPTSQLPPSSSTTDSDSDSAVTTEAESSSNTAETPSHSLGELSTRALKQEYTLNNQLAQLRADDRRSLLHLPASQQRALLATHHKQMEKARRTEQTQRGNLESAGNKFNCLGKMRLIRKPPHTGNVSSLNR